MKNRRHAARRGILLVFLSLVFTCFVGEQGSADNGPVIDFKIDSIDIISSDSYSASEDFFTVPATEGYFPVYLSGWQFSNNTEYIYSPQNISLTNSSDDILVYNEIWSESVDTNQSKKRRISILILLKSEIYYDDWEKILEKVNQLILEIDVEQHDAMNETESRYYSIKTQPQIDTVRTAVDIAFDLELIDKLNYLEAAEYDPNIIYYAELIKNETQVTDITCWKIEYQITAPWPIKNILGYHNDAPTSRIVYFNSSEPLTNSSKITMYLLYGHNNAGKAFQKDLISIWEEIEPRLIVSPEPQLIGNHIGGPYYSVILQVE